MFLVPFHAFFAADDTVYDDTREMLAAADAVVAVDVMTGYRLLVFGKTVLEQIAAGGRRLPASTVAVELDMDAGELQRLIHLVQAAKGAHGHV